MTSPDLAPISRRLDQGPKGRVERPSLHDKPLLVETRSLRFALRSRRRRGLLMKRGGEAHHFARRADSSFGRYTNFQRSGERFPGKSRSGTSKATNLALCNE